MGKYLAYLQVLVLYLLLVTGCRVQRAALDPLASEPCVDSITVAAPGHTARRVPATKAIRLGKKGTVNYYLAPVSNVGKKATVAAGGSTVSTIGKNKGNAVVASDSAQLLDQHGATNAAVAAKGAAITQTNTAPKPPTIGAIIAEKLAGPPGIVLGLAVAGGLAYGLYWLVFIKRKKDQVQTLV